MQFDEQEMPQTFVVLRTMLNQTCLCCSLSKAVLVYLLTGLGGVLCCGAGAAGILSAQQSCQVLRKNNCLSRGHHEEETERATHRPNT